MRSFDDDDIEPQENPIVAFHRALENREHTFLSEKKLRFVAAWTGNLIAAARTAGYQDPKSAAYKLMRDPHVVKALQQKQESLLKESGEHLARTLPLSRADVIDRLWQLAQLHPSTTNSNITGQVKAAQALEEIFALNIDENDLLKRQLEGRLPGGTRVLRRPRLPPASGIKTGRSRATAVARIHRFCNCRAVVQFVHSVQ